MTLPEETVLINTYVKYIWVVQGGGKYDCSCGRDQGGTEEDHIRIFRKKWQIRVSGTNPPVKGDILERMVDKRWEGGWASEEKKADL